MQPETGVSAETLNSYLITGLSHESSAHARSPGSSRER